MTTNWATFYWEGEKIDSPQAWDRLIGNFVESGRTPWMVFHAWGKDDDPHVVVEGRLLDACRYRTEADDLASFGLATSNIRTLREYFREHSMLTRAGRRRALHLEKVAQAREKIRRLRLRAESLPKVRRALAASKVLLLPSLSDALVRVASSKARRVFRERESQATEDGASTTTTLPPAKMQRVSLDVEAVLDAVTETVDLFVDDDAKEDDGGAS